MGIVQSASTVRVCPFTTNANCDISDLTIEFDCGPGTMATYLQGNISGLQGTSLLVQKTTD